MKHLTEDQLNEYLDNAVEAPVQARMALHLSGCADCRARLVSLQTVFQALAALPEETPGRDLTPSVLQALPRQLLRACLASGIRRPGRAKSRPPAPVCPRCDEPLDLDRTWIGWPDRRT